MKSVVILALHGQSAAMPGKGFGRENRDSAISNIEISRKNASFKVNYFEDVGKFKVNDKPEMERRNPRTGEMFTSPAKKVVKITPAKVLRDAVNA